MTYSEDEYLLISGIQHFCFCRRQWALIHIEQLWAENFFTTEGNIIHEKTHDPFFNEKRNDIIYSAGMDVSSPTLGVTGTCDMVELHKSDCGVNITGRDGLWTPVPIEYKRGKSKDIDADRLQLCCQAMCLEEMLCCEITDAYLFYSETRRREKVELTGELRKKVSDMTEEMHKYYTQQYTPKVKEQKGCRMCSLSDLCIPTLNKNISASEYIKNHTSEEN